MATNLSPRPAHSIPGSRPLSTTSTSGIDVDVVPPLSGEVRRKLIWPLRLPTNVGIARAQPE